MSSKSIYCLVWAKQLLLLNIFKGFFSFLGQGDNHSEINIRILWSLYRNPSKSVTSKSAGLDLPIIFINGGTGV